MQFILNGILSYNRRKGHTKLLMVVSLKNISFFCCSLLDTSVSGSPIIQNGKIVGAVTHVFVEDPTKGYGIFIEEMVEEKK